MDWYLDLNDEGAIRALRHDVEGYLARHSEPGSDVAAATIVVSELVTNAALHAPGPVWVSLDWSGPAPVLTVHDLGEAFSLRDEGSGSGPLDTGGRGLLLAAALAPRLEAAAKAAGGGRVTAELPVRRKVERSIDPVPRRGGALPALDEARPDGSFDRESFLRALVVQLAQHLEREHGPESAEAAVAHVGMDVGGRMEDAYRRARGITQRLTNEQMADLFVRLKHAIEGDFFVIESTDERIVLGNRRCPFGEAVRRSPALCRMTSSVFGGISARNAEGSAVQLEERIAVGDPQCRVTVWLRDPSAETRDLVHFYEERDRAGA